MSADHVARTSQPVLAAHRGDGGAARRRSTARPRRRTSSPWSARYIQFNSAFGPGLANLAGEIAARQGLFRDPDEPVRIAGRPRGGGRGRLLLRRGRRVRRPRHALARHPPHAGPGHAQGHGRLLRLHAGRSSTTCIRDQPGHRDGDGPRSARATAWARALEEARPLPRHGLPHRQRDPGRPGVHRARRAPAGARARRWWRRWRR